MDVLLVDQRDVLGTAVVTPEDLDMILLELAGLFRDVLVGVRQLLREKPAPLVLAELNAIECFQLAPKISHQLFLAVDRQILIALLCQKADKFPLQRGLALVAVRAGLDWLILRHNGVFICRGDDIEIAHKEFASISAFLSCKTVSIS